MLPVCRRVLVRCALPVVSQRLQPVALARHWQRQAISATCWPATAIATRQQRELGASRRHESTWAVPPPPSGSLDSRRHGFVTSTTAAVGATRSLLVYSAPAISYVRAFTAVLLLALATTVYAAWPKYERAWYEYVGDLDEVAAEEIRNPPVSGGGEDAGPDCDAGAETAKLLSAGASAPSLRRALVGDIDDGSLMSVCALQLTLSGLLLLTWRFNRRLLRSVRLYPATRTLAIECIGMFRSPPVQLVPLDALLPPMALHGNAAALSTELPVAAHPTVTLHQAHGQPDLSATRKLSIRAPFAFRVFPLPNGAMRVSDFTTADRTAVEQFWLRTVTTNVHSQAQMDALSRINLTHGR